MNLDFGGLKKRSILFTETLFGGKMSCALIARCCFTLSTDGFILDVP